MASASTGQTAGGSAAESTRVAAAGDLVSLRGELAAGGSLEDVFFAVAAKSADEAADGARP